MIGSIVSDGMRSSPALIVAAAPADTYRTFMEAHLDEAYRLATYILGNRDDAQDAVHEAAISAWRHWPDRQDPTRSDAWFRRIVVNAARDCIRARARVRTLPLDLALEARRHPVAPDHAATIDAGDALARLLAGLDPDERAVLGLRFGLDLTVPAIAAALGAREGTVKSRIHRALGRVRRALEADR